MTLGIESPSSARLAPEWQVQSWLNTTEPLSLSALRGRVVVLHAFQMLCPGCVSHGIPQAQRIARTFERDDVTVVGLHTVFEHHDAMGATSLKAFLHEYRVHFPVGIDAPAPTGPVPATMHAYQMRGTPTLILIDREGRERLHAFGRPDDLDVGAAIATLLGEPGRDPARVNSSTPDLDQTPADTGCHAGACALPSR